MAELNLFQRINEVRKAVHYIRKDKRVEGYLAVTHDAVTALVRNHLIENGIIIAPTLAKCENTDTGTTTSKGTPIWRHEAIYDVAFINMDAPDERLVMTVVGQANDHGDKGPGKALSYAVKGAILKLFNLETGENEEGRAEAYAEKISADQAAEIRAALGQLDPASNAGFMAWAKVKRVEDIGQPAFTDCMKMLSRKIEKMQKETAGE